MIMYNMDLEQSIHKAIVQAVGRSCYDEINNWESIMLTVQLSLYVDHLNKLEYSIEDVINRSEQLCTKQTCADKEIQTALKEDNETKFERAQNLQDNKSAKLILVKTEVSDVDETTADCTYSDDIAKVILHSPELHSQGTVSDVDETTTDCTYSDDIAKVIFHSPQLHSQGTGLQCNSLEGIACHMCALKFSNSDKMEEHLKKCHDVRNQFPCKMCQKLFPSTAILEKHFADNHGTEKSVIRKKRLRHHKPVKVEVVQPKYVEKVKLKMENCNTSKTKKNVINMSRNTRSRKRIVKKEKEENVDFDNATGKDLANHQNIKELPKIQRTKKIIDENFIPENGSSTQVKCANCGKCYKSKRALRRHFSIVHDQEEYQCEICGKNFNGKESLYHHKRGIHDNLKHYKCTEPGCDATFSFNHSLRLHKLKHSGARPHMCNFCGKTYLTAYHLKVHVQAIHSEKKNFSCRFCGKLFSYSTSLKMHEMSHENEDRVKCEHCEKTFVNKQALKYHVMCKHTDPGYFPCDQCGKICKTDFLLHSHKRRHTTDNRFMCDLCGRQFMYKSTLEMHKACHKDEKNYECKICKKTFKTYPTLYSHHYVHKVDSPFECSECGKAFKTKERLKTHFRRHSGSKPFECPLCHHCFPDKGGLSKHTRTVHCSVKKFVCDICGKATSRADNLRVHMKVHSKDDYKPKLQKRKSKSVITNCQNVPSSVSNSFDINNFHCMKTDKSIRHSDDSSKDSVQSDLGFHNNRKMSAENHQSVLPHFSTIDTAVIVPCSQEQVLPLDLQNRISANDVSNYQQSNRNMGTTSENSNTTSMHEMELTQSASLPSNGVINLQAHGCMYPWPYLYSQGIQSQPTNASGFYGHN